MNQFVTEWLASWTGGNSEKILTFYHDDIFYRDPAHPQGISGKANFKKYLDKLLAKYPDWKWEVVSLEEGVNGRFYLKWRATILDFQEEGMDLIEMKDGLISINEVYFDPTRMIRSKN